MPSKQSEASIDQYIMHVINKNNPKTVEELIKLLQPRNPISEQEILTHILDLQERGKVVFKEYSTPTPSLKDHISSSKASWYWIILAIATATTILVFTIPENAYPLVGARYIIGSMFVLYLPGYSLIKALFPTKELDNIERTALNIGMSLALVPITALLLNYTPWGIRTIPVTLSLLALTTVFASVALIREHEARLKENQ